MLFVVVAVVGEAEGVDVIALCPDGAPRALALPGPCFILRSAISRWLGGDNDAQRAVVKGVVRQEQQQQEQEPQKTWQKDGTKGMGVR